MMLGQFVQALEDARTSVQLEPNFVKGYIRVAKCCVALGEIHAARQVCSTIIKQIPSNFGPMHYEHFWSQKRPFE